MQKLPGIARLAGLAAIAVLAAQNALAADMPAKAPPKAPDPPPAWFIDASIDYVYMRRTSPDGTMVVPTAGPGTIFAAQDFPFPNRSGYDARLRVGYGQFGVEGRYLGGFRWNTKSIDAGAVGNVRIGSFSNFGATDLIGGPDRSKLDSWEINGRWKALPWFTAFAGYRQFKMSDETDFNITFPAFTALYQFMIPNWKAQGGQIGAEVRLLGPGTTWQPGPFFVDVDGRVGYYHVTANSSFLLTPSTGGQFTGGAPFAHNSFIYEAGVALGYRIVPNWEVRVGYRYISIADALFAADYAVAATAQSSQAIVPNTRRLELHMATVGTRLVFP
jgi:opacity protein-like surface antigen